MNQRVTKCELDGGAFSCQLTSSPRASRTLVYIAFALYCIANAITVIAFKDDAVKAAVVLALQVMSLVMFCLSFFLDADRIRNVFKITMLLIVAIMSFYATRSIDIVWIFALAICGYDIDLRVMAKIVLATSIFAIAFALLFYFFGALNVYSLVKITGYLQSSYGFTHPNQFGKLLFLVVFCVLLIKDGNLSVSNIVACLLISIAIYYVTLSRTSFLSSIAAIAIIGLSQHRRSSKTCLLLVRGIVVASVIFSVGFMLFLDRGIQWEFGLDELLSNRLYWDSYYYLTYGINLFGHNVSTFSTLAFSTTDTQFLVDNSFVYLIIKLGLVPFAIIIGFIVSLLIHAGRDRRLAEILPFFAVFCIVGCFERYFVQIDANFLIVLYSSVLYSSTLSNSKLERLEHQCDSPTMGWMR